MSCESEEHSEPKYSTSKVVKYLRKAAVDAGLFDKSYDEPFNYLRFAIGNKYDMRAAKARCLQHLRLRRNAELKTIHLWHENDHVSQNYFPLGLIGGTGKDNRLVVVEATGLIDVNGVVGSVVASDVILHRIKFQEHVQKRMNELESQTKKRSSVVYIMDLQGLSFDPFLIPVVTGPYMNLWRGVYDHYPEWISNWFIINAPVFMSTVWTAVSPLIDPNTVAKIQIMSDQAEWLPKLLEHIEPDHLPEYWGGTMTDPDGNGKCPSKIRLPEGAVPKSLYWTPSEKAPLHSRLPYIYIAPGYFNVLSVVLKHSTESYMVYNRFSDKEYSMYILYSANIDVAPNDQQLTSLIEYHPKQVWPGMASTDRTRLKTIGAGTYHFVFGNEAAWVRYVTLYYRVLFENKDQSAVKDCSAPQENTAMADQIMADIALRKEQANV